MVAQDLCTLKHSMYMHTNEYVITSDLYCHNQVEELFNVSGSCIC